MKKTEKTVEQQIKTLKTLSIILMVVIAIDVIGTIVSWVTGNGAAVPASILCAMSCCLIAVDVNLKKLKEEASDNAEASSEETNNEEIKKEK